MGATLSSRAQWTSVSTTTSKLDFTKSNEELLKDILSFVESFPTQHPCEAEVVFKRPFVWETSLTPDKFLNLSTDEYDKRLMKWNLITFCTLCQLFSNNKVASKDGDPLLSLNQVPSLYGRCVFIYVIRLVKVMK